MHRKTLRARRWRAMAMSSLAAVTVTAAAATTAEAHGRVAPPTRPSTVAAANTASVPAVFPDSLFGRSGKLRFRLFNSSRLFALPILERLFGEPSSDVRPGVYQAAEDIIGKPFAFISLIPFGSKAGGRVGDYRVGFWPAERRKKTVRSEAYENPEGFIEVTAETQDTQISEHFRLSDFLTHDQRDVWPKYLVLKEALVDKLELVIDDLADHGVRVERMVVLSGFRTPQYNAKGVCRRCGRAKDSRHMYGDASDIYVDGDGDDRMDDLNGDGKVTVADAKYLAAIADLIEGQHPELTGGIGVYRATGVHGPFVHVDTRGFVARW